jgi:F-type H+-transporting ATPase subunit b
MRAGWLAIVLLLGLLVAFPARAAEPEPEPGAGGHAAGAHPDKAEGHGDKKEEEAGPLSVVLDLTIWTVVVFFVLVLVLRVFAWGPLLQVLQDRERGIHAALEDAQRARDEAQRLRDQFQGEINKASNTVREMLDEARRNAERTKEEMLAEARAAIQTERDRLHREIDLARDQALQQLWNQAADLATVVASKAIRRQLTPDDQRRFVDEALAELGQTRNGQRGVSA